MVSPLYCGFLPHENRLNSIKKIYFLVIPRDTNRLMHNDVTRLDGKIKQFKMATIKIFPGDDSVLRPAFLACIPPGLYCIAYTNVLMDCKLRDVTLLGSITIFSVKFGSNAILATEKSRFYGFHSRHVGICCSILCVRYLFSQIILFSGYFSNI